MRNYFTARAKGLQHSTSRNHNFGSLQSYWVRDLLLDEAHLRLGDDRPFSPNPAANIQSTSYVPVVISHSLTPSTRTDNLAPFSEELG
jgi:hypothetical protein